MKAGPRKGSSASTPRRRVSSASRAAERAPSVIRPPGRPMTSVFSAIRFTLLAFLVLGYPKFRAEAPLSSCREGLAAAERQVRQIQGRRTPRSHRASSGDEEPTARPPPQPSPNGGRELFDEHFPGDAEGDLTAAAAHRDADRALVPALGEDLDRL